MQKKILQCWYAIRCSKNIKEKEEFDWNFNKKKGAEKAAEWETFLQVQENQRNLYGCELPTYLSDVIINDQKETTAKRNNNIL